MLLLASCQGLVSDNTEAKAEEKNESLKQSCITITFDSEKESEIQIALATADGSDAIIEGCTKTSIPSSSLKTYTDPETNISVKYIDGNIPKFELTGAEVTIKGSITALCIIGDYLKVVDMHGSKSLESIKVLNFEDSLPEVNIAGCSALKVFFCGVHTSFTEESLIKILHSLPVRTKDDNALFYFIDGHNVSDGIDVTSETISPGLKEASDNAVEKKHWIYSRLSLQPTLKEMASGLKIRE